MAQKTAKTTKGGTARKTRSAGEKSLERVQDSIEAAQAALKDLRSEMNRSSHVLLTDVERTLRDARKQLRSVNRAVVKDPPRGPEAMRGQKAKTARTSGGSRRSPAKK